MTSFFGRHGIATEDDSGEKLAAVVRAKKINRDLLRAVSSAVAVTLEEIDVELDSIAAEAARTARKSVLGVSATLAPVEGEGIRGDAAAEGLRGELFASFQELRLRSGAPQRRKS